MTYNVEVWIGKKHIQTYFLNAQYALCAWKKKQLMAMGMSPRAIHIVKVTGKV